MTSVYGVTFIGARAQIMSRLLELFPEWEDEVSDLCARLSC